MQTINIHELSAWEYNDEFRGMGENGSSRLDKNLKFGQHETLLVYFAPDGQKILVDGNHRLPKMQQDPNYQTVKYTKVEFGLDEKGYFPILDGEVYKDPDGTPHYHFSTVQIGLVALSKSRNSDFAYDLENETANMVGNFEELDWSMFSKNFSEDQDLGYLASLKDETDGVNPDDVDQSEEDPQSLHSAKPKIIISFDTVFDLAEVKEQVENLVSDIPGAVVKIKG